jgi:hypothetical protein
VVIDTLSQKFEDGSLFTLSFPIPSWVQESYQEKLSNDTIIQVIHRIYEDLNHPKGYRWKLDILGYKGCILIVEKSSFKQTNIDEFHSSPIVHHFGFHKTYE